MDETMKKEPITKWLRIVYYVAIAGIFNSLLNFLPFVPAVVTTWAGRAITAVMIYCMFRMADFNGRYRTSGIFRAVMLGCTLVTAVLPSTSVLTLAASVISILAVYQEYSAHSELVAEKDPGLSGKWHSLFNWGIVSAVLVGFGSTVAVVILSVLGMEVNRTASIIVAVLSIPQLILDAVYLMYVKKMIGIFDYE